MSALLCLRRSRGISMNVCFVGDNIDAKQEVAKI